MDRRRFLALAGGTAAMLPPLTGQAQQAAPAATPASVYVADFIGEVSKPKQAVFRSFDGPPLGPFKEGLLWISALGLRFWAEKDVVPFLAAFADAYRQWDAYGREIEWSVSDLRTAAVREIGDHSFAWTYILQNDVREWERGVVGTVKGTWLQILVGSTSLGSSVVMLADIAQSSVERWPDTRPSHTESGIHVGDVWSALPTLADIPEGMSLEVERETSF